MKKVFVLLMLGLFMAGNALAVVDPNPNMLSFYFDQNADVYEFYSMEYLQAYLIVTNPSFSAIKGMECYLDWDESACMFLGMLLPPGGLNVGDHHNVFMGLGTVLLTSEAAVMATYNLLPLGATYFTLGAARPPSIEGDLPVVVDGDDNMFQIGVSAGADNVCAFLNMETDEAKDATWGGVKSLYR